jgi:nucleolin
MAEEVPKATEEVPEEDDMSDSQDIFYVCKKTLEALKEKLKKNEEVTQETVNELTFPENLADDEMMVPVDMSGVGDDFDDVEQMVEKLGPKGSAEAFIKAAEYFEANKDKEPEDERPKPMTAAEWKKVLEEADAEGEEEDGFSEEEEEEALEEAEEEEGAEEEAEGDAEGGEPPAKKAKTDGD